MIIRTASNDFARLGIKGVSMSGIASGLRISKKTLYEYFVSKEALLSDCVRYMIVKNNEQIVSQEATATDPLNAIILINSTSVRQAVSMCPAFYQDISRFTALSQLMEGQYVAFIHDRYLNHFRQGVNSGIFPVDYNCLYTLRFFDDQIRSICTNPRPESSQQIESYARVILTFLAGVCTDKGRDRIKALSPKIFRENNQLINNE